ncbi:MAG: cardiolipin synthase [Pontiellaceae bacterium]|nr:cardiolipin synthase [Pontiellaceae bacterium]
MSINLSNLSILAALHILAFTAVSLHALKRRRNASATILWIFVVWSLPLLGALLYLAFGIDRVPNKGLRNRMTNEYMMKQRENRHADETSFVAWHYNFRTPLSDINSSYSIELNRCMDILSPEHPLLEGNVILPLAGGDEAYPLMLEAIKNARNHIHLQSFIIGNDAIGKEFLKTLDKKAAEGVVVRLLFDRLGSSKAHLLGLFHKYRKQPNFQICGWTQANPLKRQFQINLRNHRKNLIIDGQIAFFGGVNIASHNVSTEERKGIRDYHFKVEGPMVHELQFSFLRDWYFMTNEPVEKLICTENFPEMLSIGDVRMRLIDSGPSHPPGLATETFFNAVILARQQILIVTPYFVPNHDILRALRSAAHRGVDVRLILPKKNNHHCAGLASRALYEDLLTAGVRIFHREPPFIHAKAMVIDSRSALVGTANVDIRSLELNYETMALIDDEAAVNKLKQLIHEDLAVSTEVLLEEWLLRPAVQKLGENLCSLMTPVL